MTSNGNPKRPRGFKADKQTGWIPLASIAPWPKNPNRHPPEQLRQLGQQFRQYGYIDPATVVWIEEDGVHELRAGHGRVEALQALLEADPNFVPKHAPGVGMIRATVVSFATRVEADAYGLANNRLASISDMDEDAEVAMLRSLADTEINLDGLGWDGEELRALLAVEETTTVSEHQRTASGEGGRNPDQVPEEVPAITQPGEVVHLGRHVLHCGSCIEVAQSLPENSVDAIVGDAPYGLAPNGQCYTWDELTVLRELGKGPSSGFMGKEWDAGVPGLEWARAMFRILKPGGHLIVFCGTRTQHRMVSALQQAGFDLSREDQMRAAVARVCEQEAAQGIPAEHVRRILEAAPQAGFMLRDLLADGFEVRDLMIWLHYQGFPKSLDISKALDNAAGAVRTDRDVSGYGNNDVFSATITVRNKGTPVTSEARRWEGWGTALKPAIEPAVLCRKPLSEDTIAANVLRWGTGALNIDACRYPYGDLSWPGPSERWVDGDPDARPTQDGVTWGGSLNARMSQSHSDGRFPANVYHCPKPSTGERERGMEGIEGRGNAHPTVKPIRLMRWLTRLVTPSGGTVFNPFGGSGTDLIAADVEGFTSICTELDPNYCDIIRVRYKGWVEE